MFQVIFFLVILINFYSASNGTQTLNSLVMWLDYKKNTCCVTVAGVPSTHSRVCCVIEHETFIKCRLSLLSIVWSPECRHSMSGEPIHLKEEVYNLSGSMSKECLWEDGNNVTHCFVQVTLQCNKLCDPLFCAGNATMQQITFQRSNIVLQWESGSDTPQLCVIFGLQFQLYFTKQFLVSSQPLFPLNFLFYFIFFLLKLTFEYWCWLKNLKSRGRRHWIKQICNLVKHRGVHEIGFHKGSILLANRTEACHLT